MRIYHNFEEIDRDLKLLQLQKEVDKERVLLNYNRTKESLSPKELLKSAGDSLLRNPYIFKGVNKILGFIGERFQ